MSETWWIKNCFSSWTHHSQIPNLIEPMNSGLSSLYLEFFLLMFPSVSGRIRKNNLTPPPSKDMYQIKFKSEWETNAEPLHRLQESECYAPAPPWRLCIFVTCTPYLLLWIIENFKTMYKSIQSILQNPKLLFV